MGIFDFLFGGKRKQPEVTTRTAPSNDECKAVIRSGFLTIDDIDFFGPCATSPSGEWIIACVEGAFDGSKLGRYVLYNAHEHKVYLQGNMERPNSGHVADNGTFSLEDWLFSGNLNGIFYVIEKSGETVISRKFDANILNSAISPNGALAVCQTANSDTVCGNILAGFDLQSKSELFTVHPSTGWADKYEFGEDNETVTVVLDKIGKFRYDRAGTFLDEKRYESARLKSKKYDVALMTAEEILKREQLDKKTVETVLSAIENARKQGADERSDWKALALKLQGIAFENLGRDAEALEAYQGALELDPKIGVKRRAAALQKQQNKP